MKPELISDFRSGHGPLNILLVGINENDGVLELFIVDHFVQFVSCVVHSFAVVGVHDEDDSLGVGIVVPPELSDLILTTDVPYVE